MKKILLLVGLVASMMLSAKDIIVLRDATKIDAKILEVSDTEVRYKRADNPNGPTFVQKTNNINVVIYENGETQMFNQPIQQTVVYQQQPEQQKQIVIDQPQPAQQQTVVYQQQPEQQSNQQEQTQTTNGKKLQFNPQPSDNFIVGLTLGYVSKQSKYSGGETTKASFLAGKENKTTPAMRFGLTINPTFKYGIGIRTGVFMEYAREKVEGYREDYWVNDITLSMPLQISYRYEIIKKLSVMLYTGPVFDFGAYRNMGDDEDGNYYKPSNWGDDKYHGFNCLWGIGAGVQWDRLRLDLGGEFGMNNIYGKDAEGDEKLNWNKPFYVSLTCFF